MREKKLKETIQATRTRSMARDVVKRFFRNKAAVFGLIVILVVLFFIIFANVIAPKELVTAYDVRARMAGPSAEHLFGTDNIGRDTFARIVHGTRITVGIGVGATLLSLVLGAILAAVCALFRKADMVIMRIVDVWNCIPAILLALVLLAVFGGSVGNLIATLAIVNIPGFTARIRSVLLNIVEQDYIQAARISGTGTGRLVLRHILPNAVNTIIVDATMTISAMMLSAAGLSFIGMGVSPPSPEWGAMLNYATEYYRTNPMLLIIPGAAVVITALAINLFGDGLRDALDPKSLK